MRAEQYARLKVLSEKLTDVVLVETDPASWPGDGQEIAKIERGVRGDRYWCKKNAAATLTLLMKVQCLTGYFERALAGTGNPADPPADGGESDLDKEVRSAEREAKRILNQLAHRTRARSN